MPKYLVTSGSHFEPFTYEELVRPVAHMQEAHNAAQDAYDQLTLETAALERYISNNEDDLHARELYDAYRTKLNDLQENLWRNGVSAQTRRDLSAARAGYASDIARLSQAIQNRQTRSKEYWDARHKNPDLIMGEDPGLSGLDKYLDNDLYGSDYYTYSGQQFMNEVGTDAKARASELLRRPEYSRDPELAGYITRLTQKGFTNDEVTRAGLAARQYLNSGDASSLKNLSLAEGILADVLLSHIESTGARGKVSDAEFGRLFDYGQAGLSQAVGESSVQELSDKQWDYNRQLSLARETHRINHPELYDADGNYVGPRVTDQTDTNATGYTWNTFLSGLESPGYEKVAKMTARENKRYEDGPKMVANPDGTSSEVASPWEMAEMIYNPQIRKDVRKHMGGLDVALPASDLLGTTDSRQTVTIQGADGRPVKLVTERLSNSDADRLGLERGGIALMYGKGKLHEEATKKFNKARKEYRDWVAAYEKANPDINFGKYAIDPNKEREFREKYNIDPSIDSDDVYSIITTTETQGDYTPSTLVGTDASFDYQRTNYGRNIIGTYNDAVSNAGGNLGKDSRFAFYKVGEGGLTKSGDGETNIDKVMGSADGKKGASPDNILSITLLPQDVAAGAGNGRPTFRMSTVTGKGSVWSADAAMLGDLVWNSLKGTRYANGWSACDAVDFLMSPILHPADVLQMDDESSRAWGKLMYNLLNDTTKPMSSVSGPVIYNPDNTVTPVSAKDVVRSRSLQNQLYDAVREYIDKVVSVPRDAVSIDHPQISGNTSTKATTYITR